MNRNSMLPNDTGFIKPDIITNKENGANGEQEDLGVKNKWTTVGCSHQSTKFPNNCALLRFAGDPPYFISSLLIAFISKILIKTTKKCNLSSSISKPQRWTGLQGPARTDIRLYGHKGPLECWQTVPQAPDDRAFQDRQMKNMKLKFLMTDSWISWLWVGEEKILGSFVVYIFSTCSCGFDCVITSFDQQHTFSKSTNLHPHYKDSSHKT